MKVKKDYGIVADHGRKQLKLQKIIDENKKTRIALVSYKDGMSVNVLDITDEAKELKRMLEEHLGYKTPTNITDWLTNGMTEEEVENIVIEAKREAKEFLDSIVHSLMTLPATDINYQTKLRAATAEELEEAITKMKECGGKGNLTRIRFCEARLKSVKKRDNKIKPFTITNKIVNKTLSKEKDEPKKETAKILTFPTADKKPQVFQLLTDGDATYEECEAKLDAEGETWKFHDAQYIIAGLKELCKIDANFRKNIMRKDKTFSECIEYITKAGKNGYCIKYGRDVNIVDCDMGLGLAIDYYNTDMEKVKAEEAKKKKAEKKEASANENKQKGKKGTARKVRK